jgi:hypothetical protein
VDVCGRSPGNTPIVERCPNFAATSPEGLPTSGLAVRACGMKHLWGRIRRGAGRDGGFAGRWRRCVLRERLVVTDGSLVTLCGGLGLCPLVEEVGAG